MNYKYEDVIEQINNHRISEVDFRVKDYSHYSNCKIIVRKDELPNKRIINLIEVVLTNDMSEMFGFIETFKEDLKIFHMGRKGSFTLKQIWNEIEIFDIIK